MFDRQGSTQKATPAHVRVRTPAARLAVMAFVLGIVIGVAGLKLTSAEGRVARAPETPTHLVKPGETLWDLAGQYGPEGGDPRSYVYRLQRLNGLEGTLSPGRLLKLPQAK